MSKPLLGLVLGTVLGLLDGLSAYLSPEAASMMLQIVVGSTIKGLLTGVLAGLFAQRMKSLLLGIVFAPAIGLILSFLAAQTPDSQGNHHYWEIMLPGGILGAIVGFATQRYGRSGGTTVSKAGVVLVLATASASGLAATQPAVPADPWARPGSCSRAKRWRTCPAPGRRARPTSSCRPTSSSRLSSWRRAPAPMRCTAGRASSASGDRRGGSRATGSS